MPYACLRKTILFHYQALFSTSNPVQNYNSKFPKQCESKEFLREICESSYKLKNNFADARVGGEILNSDLSIHKAY